MRILSTRPLSNLPPGVWKLPGEEDEPVQPRCEECGAFLRWEPDRTEFVEEYYDPKKKDEIAAVIQVEYRTCRRCGNVNVVRFL